MNMSDDFSFYFNKDEFANAINLFDKKVKEIKETFDSINLLFRELEDKDTWDSDTSRDVTENTQKISKSFTNAEDEFKAFIDYLLETMNSYELEDNKNNKTIDNNVKNLDR